MDSYDVTQLRLCVIELLLQIFDLGSKCLV